MLLNKSRAYEFMDRNGLGGLVAQLSFDTCYLSGCRGAVHVEDTVVIARDGCDPLARLDLTLQVMA